MISNTSKRPRTISREMDLGKIEVLFVISNIVLADMSVMLDKVILPLKSHLQLGGYLNVVLLLDTQMAAMLW